MNVARKSTAKLPQKWQLDQKLESKEDEADSGVASADSTDSFQDALFNLKALSGNGDIENDRSEVKESHTMATAQNGIDQCASSECKEDAEEKDILDQIDDLVNDEKSSEDSCVKTDNKTVDGSEEEDDVLMIKDDECKENSKSKECVSHNGVLDSKNKALNAKPSLRIGEKVRSTVNNIMSKLVQNNPDVNTLLNKVKPEESADSADSGDSGDPLPPRYDKGNLFDNLSKTDCKTSNSSSAQSPHLSLSDNKDNCLEDSTEEKVKVEKSGEEKKCASGVISLDSSTEDIVSKSPDDVSEESLVKNCTKDDTKSESVLSSLKSDSSDITKVGATECDSAITLNGSHRDSGSDSYSDTKHESSVKEDRNTCAVQRRDSTDVGELEKKELSQSTDCKNEKVTGDDGHSNKSDSMDISDPICCDKKADKVLGSDSNSDGETDRKRTLDDNEPDDSQPFKRSRLDEVIGKLGERVTFPTDDLAMDSFEYEDSTLEDGDSVEKQQSEEISGSTSDEEEDKIAPTSQSETIKLSKQDLEGLITTAAKKAIEDYRSAEILSLNRRIEELKESQEEWRQKAKNLERQVLDITVLQQRLEKRKAHTAALKSITTRSIGIWVTEDKFKSNTPQKLTGNRTPPTTPNVAQGVPAWAPANPSLSSSLSNVAGLLVSSTSSVVSRNTSVAHLLSQTARMPTVASCAAANRAVVPGKPTTSVPRLPGASPIYQANTVTTPINRGVTPSTSNLVLVGALSGQAAGKTVPAQQGAATTLVTPAGQAQVKVIDLTMEDDAGATRQAAKVAQVPGQGGVRAMAAGQMVRQLNPMSQNVPGVQSSAILLSSPAGTQIVNTGNIQRPGMLQVVTLANAQSLPRGSIFTVMQGQNTVRASAAAPTLTTSARDSSVPVVMTQQLPPGVTLVRPPAVGATVRASSATAGATTNVSTSRVAINAIGQPPLAAAAASGPLHQDTVSQRFVLQAAAPAVRRVHPAPLPDNLCPKDLPANLKPPPPSPGLKISRVKQGIVLSWNMSIPTDCVDIASYQLYAYQETSAAPQTSLWKKVGDVKALPLPMACTLTQFQDGNKYHFAVRAVDVHGRSGPFSDPSYIFLTKAA